jgi:STE24 endopeptidase
VPQPYHRYRDQQNIQMASMLRHPAAIVLLVLLGVLIAATAILVPWGDPPLPSANAQARAVASLPGDAVARGKEFAAATRPGSYISLLIGLVVALLLGLTPLGARLIAACGRPFSHHWLAEAVLGGLAVVLVSSLVTLPLSAWHHHILVRYGLSTQGWGAWLIDVAKSYAVTIVLSAIALAAFYTLTHFVPRWWWAWAAAGAACLVVLMSAVYPVLIEPVFNTFTPMSDSPLRTELMELAETDQVPVTDVLIADASRRTTAVNAYVSGLGPTRRIVVYDTLLKAPDDQVVSVVAHELGHAKHGDVWIGTGLAAIGTAVSVCLLALIGLWTGLLRRAGIDDIASPRGLALLLAIVAIAGLLSTPFQNAVSRRLEMRADQHALELTADCDTFAQMQTGLATTNLSDVNPPTFIQWFFGSHPSTAQRIAMARECGD